MKCSLVLGLVQTFTINFYLPRLGHKRNAFFDALTEASPTMQIDSPEWLDTCKTLCAAARIIPPAYLQSHDLPAPRTTFTRPTGDKYSDPSKLLIRYYSHLMMLYILQKCPKIRVSHLPMRHWCSNPEANDQ